MRRKTSECETVIPLAKLRKLLEEGRTVSERIGEEHDGQQVVIRFSRDRVYPDAGVTINVKWYTWDHGGCMVGEEKK